MNRRLAAWLDADPVLLLGAVFGLVSLALPWLILRANRLAVGEGVALSEIAGPNSAIVAALWVACLVAALGIAGRLRYAVLASAAAILLPATLVIAGAGASSFAQAEGPTSRASLGAGVWLALFACYVIVHSLRNQLASGTRLRMLVTWAGPCAAVVAGACGAFNDLSLARELALNQERFLSEVMRHLVLALGSVAIGATMAVPLGILATRTRTGERIIFAIASALETIPGLALFGLIIAPLSALSYTHPALREMGIRGVGAAPAVVALVLYSLLPIVQNTYAGLRQVSSSAIDAGRGMGMNRRQLAWTVEFPLAVPLIGEGVRVASVQAVGNTTIAALIGAGGLGHFIFQGLSQAAPDLILLGALPVIGLALAVDAGLGAVVRALTPDALRRAVKR